MSGGRAPTNYTDIEPMFGTMEQFDAMMKTLKEAKVRVVLDWIPNHSSNEHAWFQESRSNASSEYGHFYVWADGVGNGTTPAPPNANKTADGTASAWTFDDERQQFYYHTFSANQPDFNLAIPDVRARLVDEMAFWTAKGVAGFVVRDANFLVDDAVSGVRDLDRSIDLLVEWRRGITQGAKAAEMNDHVLLVVDVDTQEVTEKDVGRFYGNRTSPAADLVLNNQLLSLEGQPTGTLLNKLITDYLNVSTGHANWRVSL